jgi:hypothetical protein
VSDSELFKELMAGEGDDPYHRTMIVNMLRDLQAVLCIRPLFIFRSMFFRKLSFLTLDPILELSFPLEQNLKSYLLFKVFFHHPLLGFLCGFLEVRARILVGSNLF